MRWWREMLTGQVYSAHFYFIFLKVSVSLFCLYKAETVWSVTFSEANPEKFNSRFRNKMFYAGVSVSPSSGFCLFILQWPWFISQYCLSLKFEINKDYSLTMKLLFWYTVCLVFVCFRQHSQIFWVAAPKTSQSTSKWWWVDAHFKNNIWTVEDGWWAFLWETEDVPNVPDLSHGVS